MSTRVGSIELPIRKLGERQLAGLRTNMLQVDAIDAAVDSGGGLGSDAIWVRLGDDYYFITGRELLAAVLRHLGRGEDADRIPEYPE